MTQRWKVLPHGKLSQLEENILTATGQIHVPVEFPRRMTVVRLSDSRLIVWSAIALDEAEMQALEDYGRPTFLIVPNDHHRLDARAWKARYPSMQVVAPAGSQPKVEKAVHVDTTEPVFDDPDVHFVVVPCTRGHEAALVVQSVGGTTLVLNDLVGNIRDKSGFNGWFLRMLGFAGDEPHIPTPVRLRMIADKDALRGQLLEWARLDSLRRIIVSHGAPIEERPAETLRALAESLR